MLIEGFSDRILKCSIPSVLNLDSLSIILPVVQTVTTKKIKLVRQFPSEGVLFSDVLYWKEVAVESFDKTDAVRCYVESM